LEISWEYADLLTSWNSDIYPASQLTRLLALVIPLAKKSERGCYWEDKVTKDGMTIEWLPLPDYLGPDGL
jgi:hypothetical protein